MGQAQINVRTRACSTTSRTSIARTKQAALTHNDINVRGKELSQMCVSTHTNTTECGANM